MLRHNTKALQEELYSCMGKWWPCCGSWWPRFSQISGLVHRYTYYSGVHL